MTASHLSCRSSLDRNESGHKTDMIQLLASRAHQIGEGDHEVDGLDDGWHDDALREVAAEGGRGDDEHRDAGRQFEVGRLCSPKGEAVVSVQREGRRKTAEVYALHHSPFSPFWYPSAHTQPPPQSEQAVKTRHGGKDKTWMQRRGHCGRYDLTPTFQSQPESRAGITHGLR